MKGKKWRDVRNALVMVIVMVAMMSSATFAWFTLTDSPTVTGLQMTAAAAGGLLVSDNETTGFVSAIELPIANANATDYPLELVPVTPIVDSSSGVGFALPKYEGGIVSGLKTTDILRDEKLKGYVAKYTYYLKSEDGQVGVGIITGDPAQTAQARVDGTTALAAGSFVRSLNTDTATMNAANSIRVGLVIGDDHDNLIIYEPNNAVTNTGTAAMLKDPNIINKPTSTVISNGVGKITNSTPAKVDDYTSGALFNVGTSAQKVTMYIWIEGTDEDCVDEIQKDNIEAQIQFTIVGDTVATP